MVYSFFVLFETVLRGDDPLTPKLSLDEMELLLRSPLFVGGEGSLLPPILSHQGCTVESFSPGLDYFTPQRFHRALGIVLSGRLRVTKDTLSVSVLYPGNLFGAAALYDENDEYAATLTPLEQGRALLFDQGLVDELLASNDLIRENYLRYLTGRIRFLNGRLHTLAAGAAEEKLVRYLLDHPNPAHCSATELAHRLGISRASLYRAFQSLEEPGLIRRLGKEIFVSDPAALAQLIQPPLSQSTPKKTNSIKHPKELHYETT